MKAYKIVSIRKGLHQSALVYDSPLTATYKPGKWVMAGPRKHGFLVFDKETRAMNLSNASGIRWPVEVWECGTGKVAPPKFTRLTIGFDGQFDGQFVEYDGCPRWPEGTLETRKVKLVKRLRTWS